MLWGVVDRSIASQGSAVRDLQVVVPGERRAHLLPAALSESRTTIAPVALQQFKDSRQRWVKAAWRGKALWFEWPQREM
jgi:hypothetical protein